MNKKCSYKDIEVRYHNWNYYTIDEYGNSDEMIGNPDQGMDVAEWNCTNCGESFNEDKLISRHVKLEEEDE